MLCWEGKTGRGISDIWTCILFLQPLVHTSILPGQSQDYRAEVLHIQLHGEATPAGFRRVSATGSCALGWVRQLRERVEGIAAPALAAVLQTSIFVIAVAAEDQAFVARQLFYASVTLVRATRKQGDARHTLSVARTLCRALEFWGSA